MSNDAALIAAFLANKGATKIETGVRSVSDERAFYIAAREGGKVETDAQKASREESEAYGKWEREWQDDFAARRY